MDVCRFSDRIFSHLLPFPLISLLFSAVTAIPQNITIDDERGDEQTGQVPGYSPVGAWAQGSDCAGCLIKPDERQAFNGTWHDATHTPGDIEPRVASLQFNGTAIYVYFIVPNTVQFASTLTNTTFELDGQHVGDFVHVPTADENYLFNVPGYVNTTIPPGRHQLNIIGTGDTNSSVILFDYAVYTFDKDAVATTSSSTTSSTASTPRPNDPNISQESGNSSTRVTTIVGIVLGLFAVSLVVTGVWFWCRRKHRRRAAEPDHIMNAAQVEPFMDDIRTASHTGPSQSSSSDVQQPSSGGAQSMEERGFVGSVSRSASVGAFNPSATNVTLHSHDTSASSFNESTRLVRRDGGDSAISSQPPLPPLPPPPSITQIATTRPRANSKAAQREVLQQRMEDVQSTIASLRTQASIRVNGRRGPGASVDGRAQNASVSETSTISPLLASESDSTGRFRSGLGSSNGTRTDPGTESLWQRIAELQAEVEQLRSHQDMLRRLDLDASFDPPPGYVEEDSERARRFHASGTQ